MHFGRSMVYLPHKFCALMRQTQDLVGNRGIRIPSSAPLRIKKGGDFPPFFLNDFRLALFDLLHFRAAGTFAWVLADGIALAVRPAGAGILACCFEGAFLGP